MEDLNWCEDENGIHPVFRSRQMAIKYVKDEYGDGMELFVGSSPGKLYTITIRCGNCPDSDEVNFRPRKKTFNQDCPFRVYIKQEKDTLLWHVLVECLDHTCCALGYDC